MKRILMFTGIGLAILLVVAAVVPFLVPGEVYKRQIEQAATNALGRDVSLEGEVSLSVFPQISAAVGGVRVANPEGFSRENMVEAGALRGVVKWAPLISRRVEVAEIVFVDADVMLERRADGAVNWEFATTEDPGESDPGSAGTVDAGIDRARLENARLVYADAVADTRYEISELDLSASLQALDAPFSVEAAGLFQGAEFDVGLNLDAPQSLLDGDTANLALELGTAGGAISYDGAAKLTDSLALDGAFTVDGRDLSQLAQLADLDVPINLNAVGRIEAAGSISGPVEAAQITFERLSIGGQGLSADYVGALALGEAVGLGGTLSARSSNLSGWLSELGLDLPPAATILEDIDLSARLDGNTDALSLSDVALRHQGPLLDARFNGAAQLGANSALNGEIEASSDQMRDLLGVLEVELAPGETLESFSVAGDVSGSLSRIALSDLEAGLDDISAAGALTFLLDGPRPAMRGDITTGVLDLSPFLGSETQTSQGQTTGWSDAPLDLSGLNAVDADISLKADRIILGDIALDAPDLAAELSGGDFTATIASMGAFGGLWQGEFDLGASGDVATMELDLTGETIQLSDALMSLAGLNALSGVGQLRVDVSSSGNSLKELVEGLSGEMGSNLANGSIKGINVGQLVRSRESLLSSLADGSLQMALAPEAETDFTSLLAGLSLNGGVARIEEFALVNPILSLEGSGSINLGARTLDVGIVPRLDTSGQGGGSALQLNGVPIPFRIQGGWTSPGLAPDTQMIQSILRQDVEARAREAISDQIGGDVGGLLEGVLGTQGRRSTPAGSEAEAPAESAVEADAQAPAEADAPRQPEDLVEDLAREAARDALGGLFGNRRSNDDTETPPAEEEPDPQR